MIKVISANFYVKRVQFFGSYHNDDVYRVIEIMFSTYYQIVELVLTYIAF